MRLSPKQKQVHQRALYLAQRHRALEAKLVEIIRDVERLQIDKRFGMSLFKYVTDVLKLSEAFSYSLITVARKTIEIPELLAAIQTKNLSLTKATRIVSSITQENAVELIQFANHHNRREIDFEMAKRNPQTKSYDRVKPINDDEVEVKITIKRSTLEKLQRAQSLEAQKQKSETFADVLDSVLEDYLDKNDPVRKAERASNRKLWQARVKKAIKPPIETFMPKRTPLTAEQKHAVFLRDKGRCTHKDIKGHVCASDKWTEIHHITSVANGGTNDLENLTTLCSFHHDLVHQLSLPIDGQVTWLRSPVRKYG